ncbi:MAG: transketolase C-terminal domain-containing protein [Candidatus Moranbacteria bacterium]|nr:transketolase C-terminal domain-containing protein [Candidatus Moranbacteria bacterium]
MRNEFCKTIENIAVENEKVVFMTGDLGFMALEGIQKAIGDRFINAGVSEQNMLTMAASIASEGFTVLCYSIAPFVVFRPAEQIRLDVCLHDMDVKIIGNGGGYGYGIMGGTHHAIEDIAVLSSFQNMKCYIPFCAEEVREITTKMMNHRGPAYIRLEKGAKPENLELSKYKPVRKIMDGEKITIVSLGTTTLNALEALKSFDNRVADLFVVSEMPMSELSPELAKSIKKTGKLIVLEEHVSRGGLAENLSLLLIENKIFPGNFSHHFATGYPDGLYGDQKYHQKLNGLDPDSITHNIKKFLNE